MVIRDQEAVHHDSSNVTMETGKPALASVPVHIGSVTAQAEKRTPIQAPLTAVYIHTVPALPVQPYIQPPATVREPSTFHLSVPPLYSKETLPFVTLHLAGGLQPQPRPSLAAVAPTAKPKSAGKHVCPHCGRDCMKPSVLEKHLRCHTGERPYPCTTCGVSFKTQSNLYKHRRTQAHARLSSESEQSSLDSMSSSRETCSSSLSLDEHSEELGSVEKNDMPPTTESSSPASPTQPPPVQPRGSDSEQTHGHMETKRTDETKEDKQTTESSKRPSAVGRHLPLQRQEATLFSKQWGSSVSRGKSQSHESTDSGFSESGDHYPSPSSVLPDHGMNSLTESNEKPLEGAPTPSEKDRSDQEPRHTAKKREQKMLAEHISKLISENTAVVEDKKLENVRPRKTVLSKQGSIDLPMPYTFKDSFHFDMKINPTQNIGLKKHNRPSLPTQCSSTMKHAPLTRSNSLPFSITLMQPERGSPASPYQGDYVTIVRRGSSGQINPTDLARKPVNQHSSSHRPLVRQTAVDCNHATDGLFANSSVEEACTSSLSCDGDVGDVCGEPNIRKFQRKKAQKFAYNKWYMYGNGTFKKLYGSNKNPDNGSFKGRKGSTNPQPEGLQSRGPEVQQEDVTTSRSTVSFKHSEAAAGRPAARLSLVSSVDSLQRSLLNSADGSMKAPLRRNLSLSLLPVLTTGSVAGHKPELSRTEAGRCSDVSEHTDSSWRLCGAHVPSDRKKQRTDDKTASSIDMETDPNTPPHPPPSVVCSAPQDETNPKHSALQGAVFLPYILNPNVPPISASPASSIPAAAKSTFLPKYQLKLPNSRDVDFNASPQVLSTETIRPEASCAPSDQTPASATAYGERGENPGASLLVVQAGESSRMKTLTSTPEQLLSPGVVTSSHGHSSTSSLAVVQRQVATTTKTTSCLRDYSGGLCSALLQSAADSAPTPLPPPLAPAAESLSSTTATNQMSAATVAAVGPDLPPAHTRLSAASDSANPENRALVCSSAPVPPCPVVPLDQPAQNVFHVHTADLQICLQIISDEQLALIAPQIERPSGTGLSQTCDIQATNPESETRRSPTREAGDDGGDHGQSEHQKTDGRGTWPNMERTSSVSEQFLKWEQAVSLPDQHLSEASAVCPSQQTHGHMAAQPPSSEGSFTSASLRAGTLGGLQTLENEQLLRLNRAAEDRRVSQRFCDQNKLSMSSFSTGTENQNGTKNDLPAQSHGELFSEGSLKTSGDVLSDRDSWTESGEGLRRTSGGVWIHESGESKTPSQTPVCCSPQGEPAFNRSQSLSKVRRSYAPPSSPGEPLHDGTSSDQSETSLGLVTSQSSYILGRRAEDPAAVWTAVQDPPAGTSLVQNPAQKEQQMQEHAGTSQPENSDWRPKQREVEAETIDQTSEEQGAAVVTGEEKNQGVKTNRTSESCCRCVVPPDVTKLQRGGTKVEVDSFKSSSLSKQHLQTQSECPPAAPPQDQSTSHSPALPASSLHVSLLNPALEVNQLRSPLKTWGISSTQDQPVQVFHESVSSGHVQVQLSETQNVLSKPNSNFHSLSHHSKNQTYGSMAAQQGHTSAGSYESAVGSYDFLPSESSKNTSFSPDFRTQTSSQFTHISLAGKTPAGLTENNQNTGPSSNPFTYLEFDEKQNPISTTPYEQTGPTSHCGRPDMTNKYQPMFMVGSFHGYQTPECLSGAVRPVPICQDFTEDTSSSDDEGKLIIEL